MIQSIRLLVKAKNPAKLTNKKVFLQCLKLSQSAKPIQSTISQKRFRRITLSKLTAVKLINIDSGVVIVCIVVTCWDIGRCIVSSQPTCLYTKFLISLRRSSVLTGCTYNVSISHKLHQKLKSKSKLLFGKTDDIAMTCQPSNNQTVKTTTSCSHIFGKQNSGLSF